MSNFANNYLIFQNIWNSCANSTPRYTKESLVQVLNKSRENLLWNENRLDPEDDKEIAGLIHDLDIIADHFEYIKSRVCAIALKYKEKEESKTAGSKQ